VVYEAEESAEAAAKKDDDEWAHLGDFEEDEEEIDFSNTGSYALTISSKASAEKSKKKNAEIEKDASALSNFNDGLADATATVRRLLARDTPKYSTKATSAAATTSGDAVGKTTALKGAEGASSAAASSTTAAGANQEEEDEEGESPWSPPLEMAMALLAEMKDRARVPPNFVTYSALLAACDKVNYDLLEYKALH